MAVFFIYIESLVIRVLTARLRADWRYRSIAGGLALPLDCGRIGVTARLRADWRYRSIASGLALPLDCER